MDMSNERYDILMLMMMDLIESDANAILRIHECLEKAATQSIQMLKEDQDHRYLDAHKVA